MHRAPGGGLVPIHTKEFGREAKRIVAAECCHFLRPITSKSERAKPYVHWLGGLGKQNARDTIITFNYDRVIEKLASDMGREIMVAGTGAGDLNTQEQRAEASGAPLLIKLHGSVDWERVQDSAGGIPFQQSSDPEYASKQPEGQIATPGDGKVAASEGELKPLWTLAQRKLREAHEVIFVGYRIPETDATARELLLDALERNRQSVLRVVVVLGPPSFDRERLGTLLRLAMPRRRDGFKFSAGDLLQIEIVDGWAQDYLQARRL